MSIGDWDEGTLARFIEDVISRDPTIAALLGAERRHFVGAAGEPTFVNSWVNNAGLPAGFYRKGERVYLFGDVVNGTMAATIFTLPDGFRPAAESFFPCMSFGAFGYGRVEVDGRVIASAGSNSSFSLDGWHFRVA